MARLGYIIKNFNERGINNKNKIKHFRGGFF